ncbi:MAG: flagellar export protein FliJ [Caulobacteraceae bacterium]
MAAKWADSLIRIAKHEVETLQKRVAEITARRVASEQRLQRMHAEAEHEAQRARTDPEAGWSQAGYMKGWRVMREQLTQQIAALLAEEAGARDALSMAFEELKKFEHVAEMARLADAKELAKRESAAMDEMGLRKATGR